MYKSFLYLMIIFGFYSVINDIIHSATQRRYGKKCNYDCSKCKSWDCPNHECLKHRGE